MSDFDIGAFAAEVTGSTGVPDAPDHDTALPNSVADEVELFDDANRERDARNSTEPPSSDAADADGAEPPAGQLPRKQVPLAALQEERQRRQEINAQLQQERVAREQLQQQLAQLQAAQQQAQIPEFADDPEGHVRALSEQFEQRLAAQQQQLAQRDFEAQVQRQTSAVAPSVVASERALADEVGEDSYRAAFDLVDQHVNDQLRAMHPGADPQTMQQVKALASLQFVQQCQTSGIDPARHVWEFAQQLGFTPGARVPHAPSGDLPRVARVPGNTSLGSVGGAADPTVAGKLTAASVSAMSDAEFDQLCANMRRQSASGPRV
ncbi:hypothetical protein [Pseudomonas plecoglossicida]|uniref:hypothetical protein n=1 Tax=Pseudomonas plecoglossicida TaxID=70775 RepID=UPI00048D1262|nr:hypothetical protein [Pseudomonas plecoglossicida]GLR36168.1 hypothetical protein GCM10011247_15650 [Pseudomonas plecoglossicida]